MPLIIAADTRCVAMLRHFAFRFFFRHTLLITPWLMPAMPCQSILMLCRAVAAACHIVTYYMIATLHLCYDATPYNIILPRAATLRC